MLLSGFKSLGDGRWVGFFSNIFYDRDIKPDAPRGERFTLDALKEASEWMNDGNLPVLEIFHLDGFVVGKATDTYTIGPFIIAEGVWNDDELGSKAREYFDKSEKNWRMSHGFSYFSKDRIDGEYTKFRPHEVTILPEEWAANPYTLFKEADVSKIQQDIQRMLVEVFNMKPDEAEAKVADELAKAGKALPDGALPGKKEGEEAAAPVGTEAPPTPTEEPAKEEPTPEEPAEEDEGADDDALALALVDALTELSEERALRVELQQDVKAMQTGFETATKAQKAKEQEMESRIKALEDADKERQSLLPKAVREALSKRAGAASTVEATDADKDIKGREAGLTEEVNAKSDPVGFTMRKAGIG